METFGLDYTDAQLKVLNEIITSPAAGSTLKEAARDAIDAYVDNKNIVEILLKKPGRP